MPVIPKSKTIQLRVDNDLFDKFSVLASDKNTTVSGAIRHLMAWALADEERRRAKAIKDAEWAATLESRRQASLAASQVEKSPVGPVNKPMSLSEKRKAEKVAKEARKARREDRY